MAERTRLATSELLIERTTRFLADGSKVFLCRFPDLVLLMLDEATMPRCRDISAVGVERDAVYALYTDDYTRSVAGPVQ
jgi:hypothetical protein